MKGRAFALLAFVLLVCLVMLTVQSRGGFPRAGEYVARVATPVQTALARIHRTAFGVWATYRDWKNVRAENARLRDEIQRLRVDGLVVGETLEENRRLRQLLTLRDRLPLATMPGEVIARESNGWVRSLTVNRGREDHVGRLTAVISPAGLIGRVVDVRPGASIIQVLTDPASTVGAHVVRTRTPGIVEGEARGSLRFKYMARDGSAIEVGDLIVTSGHGGLFPRGIPVGRVRSIDDRGSALFHFAILAPLVDFARVDEVLLLTGETTQDLAGHFPTDG
jgi:rod shape-determining protein MreC